MKVIINPKKKLNVLATIVIGKESLNNWKKFALPSWKKYCNKYGIGLVYFTRNLLKKDHPKWKKPTWQKLLIGTTIKKSYKFHNVCYLDSDIIINYISAPNIFLNYNIKTFGLVSETFNLPYDLNIVKKKLSFYRHYFYDKKYPLDSSLFMNLKDKYIYHNLKPQKNYACMGLVLFNIKNHSKIMENWFYKYDSSIKTITGDGDEPILNYEILNYGKISWLNYKFQALWIYEMAWYYPFLYKFKNNKNIINKYCIESSLLNNYFLHFAGSWFESNMWKIYDIFTEKNFENINYKLNQYFDYRSKGKPHNKQIKPRS